MVLTNEKGALGKLLFYKDIFLLVKTLVKNRVFGVLTLLKKGVNLTNLPELIHSEGFGPDKMLVIALYRSQNGSRE